MITVATGATFGTATASPFSRTMRIGARPMALRIFSSNQASIRRENISMILVLVIPEFDTPNYYCDSNPALRMLIVFATVRLTVCIRAANQGILLDVLHATAFCRALCP